MVTNNPKILSAVSALLLSVALGASPAMAEVVIHEVQVVDEFGSTAGPAEFLIMFGTDFGEAPVIYLGTLDPVLTIPLDQSLCDLTPPPPLGSGFDCVVAELPDPCPDGDYLLWLSPGQFDGDDDDDDDVRDQLGSRVRKEFLDEMSGGDGDDDDDHDGSAHYELTIGAVGPQGVQGKIGSQGDTGDTGAQGEQGKIGPIGPQGATGPAEEIDLGDLLALTLHRWTSNSQEYEFKLTPNATDEMNSPNNHPWIPWGVPPNTPVKFRAYVSSAADPSTATTLKAQIRTCNFPASARILQNGPGACVPSGVGGIGVTVGGNTCDD